jgi:hypothetical protein
LIAVIVSLVVVLYVLVPGGIFRLITSFTFPVKVQKTKSQEITFATLFALLPFVGTILLAWTVAWPWPTPEDNAQRRLAYRTVFTSVASDKQMDAALEEGLFWPRANDVLRRQFRFLIWFYTLVGAEAAGFSWLAKQYRTEGKRWRDRIGGVVLRPSLSEWAVLLTNFGSPKTRAYIELDVLSTDGVLYQGRLRDYYFSSEGDLAGVLLSGASRYDRVQYAAHQQVDFAAKVAKWPSEPEHRFTRDRATYWRAIPGADLFYIPREKISNVNVRHVTSPEDVPKAAQERLVERKITGYAIVEQPSQATSEPGESATAIPS